MIDLKKQIKSKGKTLQEIADTLGKSKQNFGQQVNHNPTLSLIEDIASACGCSVSELLRSTEDDNQSVSISCPHCGKPIQIETKISAQ